MADLLNEVTGGYRHFNFIKTEYLDINICTADCAD